MVEFKLSLDIHIISVVQSGRQDSDLRASELRGRVNFVSGIGLEQS